MWDHSVIDLWYSKMVPHVCRVVCSTLHAYEFMWESCIQWCDYMWWCVHDYVNNWWFLCTWGDGVELWIMWIDLVITWWCKYLIYLEFMIWKLICLFIWECYLKYWIVDIWHLLPLIYSYVHAFLFWVFLTLLRITAYAILLGCVNVLDWGRVIVVSTRG